MKDSICLICDIVIFCLSVQKHSLNFRSIRNCPPPLNFLIHWYQWHATSAAQWPCLRYILLVCLPRFVITLLIATCICIFFVSFLYHIIEFQFVNACRRKVRKLCKTTYFLYFKLKKKRHNFLQTDAKWHHSNLIWSTLKQSPVQSFSSICQNM